MKPDRGDTWIGLIRYRQHLDVLAGRRFHLHGVIHGKIRSARAADGMAPTWIQNDAVKALISSQVDFQPLVNIRPLAALTGIALAHLHAVNQILLRESSSLNAASGVYHLAQGQIDICGLGRLNSTRVMPDGKDKNGGNRVEK